MNPVGAPVFSAIGFARSGARARSPARAAQAIFHLTKVVEVFPGTEAAPNAQYVVVADVRQGQNSVGGHSV